MKRPLESILYDLTTKIEYGLDIGWEIPEAELTALKARARQLQTSDAPNVESEARDLQEEVDDVLRTIFSGITPRQIIAVTRTQQRPKARDYLDICFDSWQPVYREGSSIVCAEATLDGSPVVVVAHDKSQGNDAYGKFGSLKPEGNRLALLAMRRAEEQEAPIISLIDTPGAWPLPCYESAEVIAYNILGQLELAVPHLSVIIGEGGSGGALALAIGDLTYITSLSYFNAISLEGARAIYERKTRKSGALPVTEDFLAEGMNLTAQQVLESGVVQRIIQEPRIGARVLHHPGRGRLLYSRAYFQAFREELIQGLDEICRSVWKNTDAKNRWQLSRRQGERLMKKRRAHYKDIGTYGGKGAWPGLWHPIAQAIEKHTAPVRNRIHDAVVPRWSALARPKARAEPKPVVDGSKEPSWVQCPSCQTSTETELLYDKYWGICPTPKCGYHFQLPSAAYLDLILDEGSWREFNGWISSINPQEFEGFDAKLAKARKDTGRNSAMVTGYGKVDGMEVVVALLDSGFRGGTIGCAEGAKFVKAAQQAIRKRWPFISINDTGGVRIEEGAEGLMAMAMTVAAVKELKDQGLPYIAVFGQNSYAGALASYMSTARTRIAEPNSRISLAGLDVILRTTGEEGKGTTERDMMPEIARETGHIEYVVPRTQIREISAHELRVLQATSGSRYGRAK